MNDKIQNTSCGRGKTKCEEKQRNNQAREKEKKKIKHTPHHNTTQLPSF